MKQGKPIEDPSTSPTGLQQHARENSTSRVSLLYTFRDRQYEVDYGTVRKKLCQNVCFYCMQFTAVG